MLAEDLRDSLLTTITEDVPRGLIEQIQRRYQVLVGEVDAGLAETPHFTDRERNYRRGHDLRCEVECLMRQVAVAEEMEWTDKPYPGNNGLTHVEITCGRFLLSQHRTDSPGGQPTQSESRKIEAARNRVLTQMSLFESLPEGSQLKMFGPSVTIQLWLIRCRVKQKAGADLGHLAIAVPHEDSKRGYHAVFEVEELQQMYLAQDREKQAKTEPTPRIKRKEKTEGKE